MISRFVQIINVCITPSHITKVATTSRRGTSNIAHALFLVRKLAEILSELSCETRKESKTKVESVQLGKILD